MLAKFFDSLKNDGPIRFLINLFCLLILYICLYIIYFWIRLIYLVYEKIILRKKANITTPFYIMLHAILTFIFNACIILVAMLGELFILLWIVWKILRTILGLFAFIIDNLPIFKECRETGLFGLFDNLSNVLFGSDAFAKRIEKSFDAILEFLKTFMESTFGIVFEGYELDKEYLNASLDLFLTNRLYAHNKMKCEEKKREVIAKLKNKVPLIRVHFKEGEAPRKRSDIEMIEINNCIKNNTLDIPSDTNTVKKLSIMFANEVAKKKCELGITSTKCMLSDFEDNIKNIADNVKDESITNYNKVKDVLGQKQKEYTTEVPREDIDNAMK